MKKLKENLTVLLWAIRLAYRISPKVFLFWILFGSLLAFLPSASLACNRRTVAVLSEYLATGQGAFGEAVIPLLALGFFLILTGLSRRINGQFLYVQMYDNYYFGMQEYLADCIQKADIKTLMDKEFYEDYRYCLYRTGGLTDLMSHGCITVMKSVTAVSLIGVAFSVSLPVGITAGVCFLLAVLLNSRLSSHFVLDTLKCSKLRSKSEYYSMEAKNPGAAKEMRIYHTQTKLLQKWKEAYGEVLRYHTDFDMGRSRLSVFVAAFIYLAILGMSVFAVWQVAEGKLRADVFLMLYLLGESLSDVNKTFSEALFETLRGLDALKLQHRFLTRVPLGDERTLDHRAISETISLRREASDVVFEARDLHFSYDGKTEVLHGLDFYIKKGETIALVGANGSGKSTLVKLLIDLYRPDRGELLLYGKPYVEYPQGSINHEIGMFFQNFYLFHLTLRENVGFGNLKHLKDDAKIQKALKLGGCGSLLQKCPDGLEQLLKKDVKKTGLNVSGGEQQRIAVSRTHMSEKKILIFDEPAAALDPIAELEQFENIREKIKGRTSILISHRIGFARMADRIFLMDQGRLKEVGTHEELLKKDGIYADFFRQQAQWYQEE
ncbi:MAG: ABC transporter ATP-binding protein [Lachnospiraceae bacterium]|nr:ABC transporter ATP-binding protein [Lachnospiraceae bacterium]